MKKQIGLFKLVTTLALVGLLAAACAPGEIERIPLPGQEGSGGEGSQTGGEAASPGDPGAAGDPADNIEIRPTDPVCPTPTPVVDVGTTGEELEGGEAVIGPASTREPVSGDTSTGPPDPDILDQVNQAPGGDRSGMTAGEGSVAPDPGSQTEPGGLLDETGTTGTSGSTEPSFGDLLGSVIGQVLGTSEPGVSIEVRPSPTPCP